MSMEYLTYPWMDYFFKDSADQYRKTHLEEGLRVIPYMACVDEFQHEVYAQKMADAKERYKLWHSLEEISTLACIGRKIYAMERL